MFLNKLISTCLEKQAVNLFVGLTLFMSAYTANAAVIFDQPPLVSGVAYQSNWTMGSQYADNFSLSAETTLTSIQWWGSYLTQGEDDFKVRIFSGASGPAVTPDPPEYTSLSVTRMNTGFFDSGSSEVFAYEFVLPSTLTLQAGNYYLSIINNDDVSTMNNNNPSDWLWLQSSTGDQTAWFRQSDGENWAPDAVQSRAGFALTLNGTQQQQQPVPEPGILSLFALAALVITGRRVVHRPHAV